MRISGRKLPSPPAGSLSVAVVEDFRKKTAPSTGRGLYQWSSHTGGDMCQVVVPSSLAPDVLHHLHGAPASAHLSQYGNGQGKLVIGPLCLKIFNSGEQCIPCQTRRAPAPKHRASMGGSQATLPFQNNTGTTLISGTTVISENLRTY